MTHKSRCHSKQTRSTLGDRLGWARAHAAPGFRICCQDGVCHAGSSDSDQVAASRAPETAKVAGAPREAGRGNAGAAPAAPTVVQVYAGVGKRRRTAHFDVASSRVIIEVPLDV